MGAKLVVETQRSEPDDYGKIKIRMVEDLSLAFSRQLAIQAQNGQRGMGHLGQPPAGKARGKS